MHGLPACHPPREYRPIRSTGHAPTSPAVHWAKEKPAILLILGMCVYIGLMLCIGYVLASLIVFPLALFYVGERKPGPYIVVLVSAFAIFLLFKNVFNISLPALGLLGGII